MADSNVIEVRAHGAVVDGRATGIVKEFLEEAQKEVAQQIFADLHENMNRSFKNPTPYYETQVINEVVGNTRVIHDRGIIYGHWLEGTSDRNQATSFKGYHMFRDAKRSGEARADELTEAVYKRYEGRLG